MSKNAFSGYHPAVNLLYFVLVIGCARVLAHPVCLALSFACALGCSVSLLGRRAVRPYLLPVLLVTAVANPLFSHAGVTILAYFPGGNPLTLESILYGISAAFLLVTVITWFSCFNAVMSGDKLVHLFGRAVPALSLVMSMALRFVPRFTAQAKAIAGAQKCLGRDVSQGSLPARLKHGVKMLSILVTWALENAIDTADSMKSRGYGLPGRSAFSIYRFGKRDRAALLYLLLCGGLVAAGAAVGQLEFHFYPSIGGADFNAWQAGLFIIYIALCGLPLWVRGREALQWRRASNAGA
ncbi:MAG: energy-coupling factor transporter transmembrane protein EcfT [Oscillospiraceae bacterium]|jgi:energy-coupling factor transport system permease protein|nr:energy-coupling factor transporter transmembrane protein EcfT [Oscillospiraceae bacterium]